jgi:phytoene/squalene synthetase
MKFVERQRQLQTDFFRGRMPAHACLQEKMLLGLLCGNLEEGSGLRVYLDQMMNVMAFDAQRRGMLVSSEELDRYTRWLATAVTEALHYFVGHNCRTPRCKARYLAASGAHIAHMLRDTQEDNAAGYYNIPREYLEAHQISPEQISSPAYRAWVANRVRQARACFAAGRSYLARIENLRCRLAGHAYIARFEGVLDTIEREGYHLRADYSECTNLPTGLRLSWRVLWSALLRSSTTPQAMATPIRKGLRP